MTTNQTVIHFGTVLLSVFVLVQGILFGGPSGELLPNNPQKCTGENITFTCKANGHSSSRLKFKLNDNGSLPDNATVIIDDSTRSMTLTDLTMGEHHLNILCCMNDCNKSSDIVGSTQLLRMYEYPTSVVNFSCVRFGWSNEMSCTFDLGQVYRELPNVVVRWRMRALSGSWNDCPDFDKVSKSECKWHNQSVSDRHIEVEIGITSQCGISVPEQRFKVNTSLIVKPYPLPEIRVLAVNSTCIQAVWDNPVFNQLKQYRIEISSHWTESGSEEIEPYYEVESMDTRKNESSYMFCDLVPNTVYTVTGYIKPAVEGYWSEVKVAPEDTTPKDVPFNSPNITEGAYKWDPAQCEADGKRTIYLYFNSISKRYQNGEMKAIVARGDKPFRHLELTNKTEIPADHTQLGVEVNCDTDYNFLISGRNEIGDSDIVSKIFVPKASPEFEVPKLVIETLEQKIYLHWSAEISKMVTGFTLFWCKKYRGNCQTDAVIHWKKLPADNDTAVLEISSPEDYLYSISMETQQGSTGMTWESCIYARYAVPQKHPETPTVSRSSEDNTLAVYWNKIECESGSPYIVSYKVIYCIWAKNANNCSGERSELIVPSTQTSVVLEGLKEDQEYGVIIQGLTADGQESPLSDPAFGTPENNSLETGSIVGIAIGCAFAFLIMLAGIIAIIRYCRKKAERRLRLYQIKDVLEKTTSDTNSKGYSNQVFSGYELPNGVTGGTENYKELESVPNGIVPQLPPRTERQLSRDSGIPDDPLTPRNTDERMQFPSTIDEQKPETPITPDGNFDIKWHMLPNGYTRVKTDEDNIPRILVQLNSSTDTGHGGSALPAHNLNGITQVKRTIAPQNLMDSPYVPNGPVGSLPIVPQPSLIVMTAFQPQNQISIPRPEARDVNTAEAEESGQSPVTSYLKATLVHTEEVNDKDKAQGLNDEKNARIPEELVTNKKMITETVIVPIMREANQQSSDYLPNDITAIGNTDNSPKRLANDTDRYVPHGNAQNADTTGYLPRSQMATSDPENSTSHLDPMDILVTSNVNTHDIVSGSEMQHADTAIYNTQSCGSSRPNSVDTLVVTTVNPGGYVSQSEMHHANTNSYYPHCNSPTPNSDNSRSQKSSVASSSNNGSYVSHSEMHPANTTGYVSDDNIAIPNPGNSRSHPSSLATATNTGGYVSQSEMLPTETSGYLPHNNTASSDSGNTRSHPESAATPGNTDSYISHSQMQAVNNTDYVSQAGNIGTPSSDNSRSHPHAFATLTDTGGYVSQSEMQSANTTDNVSKGNIPAPSSCSNRSLADSVASPSNACSYISHSQIHASNTTDYVPQGNIASPNFDNNRSHSDSVATPVKLDSYLSQSEMHPDDTNGYVLHDNIATSNSGNSGSHQDSVANSGGYVSQSEIQPVSTTDYVSHDSVATPNSGNNRLHSNSVATPANTDGCVSHSEIQLPNTTDYVSQGNIATPNFDNNTHSDSVATPVKTDSYVSQSEMHPPNSTYDNVSHGNIATSNSGNSGSHSNTVASLANMAGYVSQSEVQPTSTTDYVSHDSVATLNSGNNRLHSSSVTTPTNTVDYVSHSGMQPPNTTDYVSQAKIATLNSGNSRSRPNSVENLADSDIAFENETNANTIGYIAHKVPQTASINHPVSNSYIKTASVSASHIQQSDVEPASTGAYLPHTDVAVKNSGCAPQSKLATNNASGYVSLGNMANPQLDTSPSHTASATFNTSDYVLNNSTLLPTSTETGVLVPHENTVGAKPGDYVSVNGNNLPSEEASANSNDNGDKMINKTVVSHDKKLKKNEDGTVESSGNTGSSGLSVRTKSLNDHDEILKSCLDSSESAINTHSDSDNCDIQSATAAVKIDYISHDSAFIQNNLQPEETVDKNLRDENMNPSSEHISVTSKQDDLNSKCLEDKSNNNVTENLNETATGSNNLRRALNENDRKIIPNANGYVGLDQLQEVSAGQGTVKHVNGYITADQMENLHNQNLSE